MILASSAARTASGTSTATTVVPNVGAAILLDVTAAASVAGDTLNVRVQHSLDNGTTFDDFVSFTQVLGNGGAKQYVASWTPNALPDSEIHAVADGSLAAGNVLQGPVGDIWRVKWTVVSSSAPSFTFSVSASFVR